MRGGRPAALPSSNARVRRKYAHHLAYRAPNEPAQTCPVAAYMAIEQLPSQSRRALTLTIQYYEVGWILVTRALLHRLAGGLAPELGVERAQDHVAGRVAVHQGQVDAIRERQGCPKHFSAPNDRNFVRAPFGSQLFAQREGVGNRGDDMDARPLEVRLARNHDIVATI